MRGENNHATFKTIVAASHNRKNVVEMPAKNHDRKIAYLTTREPIVSPTHMYRIKTFSKKETKRKRAVRERREKKWESFGKGPLVELKTLSVMNTEIRKKTFYFKSNQKVVSIDYLVKTKHGDEVGFIGKVYTYVEDKSTGVLKFDEDQKTHKNLVLLHTFKSTFIGNKTVKEHWLRRGCYYKYKIPNHKSTPKNGPKWFALVP